MSLAASVPEGRPIADQAAVDKTAKRWEAEHSVMSAVSMAMVAAVVMFVPVSRAEAAGQISNESTMMVESANGGVPVVPVSPFTATSFDDTTIIGTPNAATGGSASFRIASTNESGRNRAHYKLESHSSFQALVRFRLSFTASAAGQLAAPWVTVHKLTERELSPEVCPSGIYVLKIEGLCAQAASDPTAKVLCSKTTKRQRPSSWQRSRSLRTPAQFHSSTPLRRTSTN